MEEDVMSCGWQSQSGDLVPESCHETKGCLRVTAAACTEKESNRPVDQQTEMKGQSLDPVLGPSRRGEAGHGTAEQGRKAQSQIELRGKTRHRLSEEQAPARLHCIRECLFSSTRAVTAWRGVAF